jgi:hypothetical protein
LRLKGCHDTAAINSRFSIFFGEAACEELLSDLEKIQADEQRSALIGFF